MMNGEVEVPGLRPVFISLSSGSSGNCYFVGRFRGEECEDGLIVDAGVSFKRLKICLEDAGIPVEKIKAVLITHDHMDHVRSLASYCKKMHVPVWTSEVLASALFQKSYNMEALGVTPHILVSDGWNEVAGFAVRYFEVPHDATQTVGYYIRIPLAEVSGAGVPSDVPCHRFFIMTDAGRVVDEALAFASEAETVVFESNYDVDMLVGGRYTAELKRRIMNGNGHLSNDECAAAVRNFCHAGLRNLFLCHLSENNNTPRLAYDAVLAALEELCGQGIIEKGAVSLRPLPRTSPSGLIFL